MATPFSIPILTGVPVFDTLPVQRVGCPCTAPRFRQGSRLAPLTLVQGCWAQESLQLHLSCFETAPALRSTFYLILTPDSRRPGRFLSFRFAPNTAAAHLHGLEPSQAAPLARTVTLHRDGGENQEGVFWGGQVRIPQRVLTQLTPDFHPVSGTQMELSLFKFSPTGPAYCLSLFPAASSHRGTLLLC